MTKKHVVILEIKNATAEQVEKGMQKAINDFAKVSRHSNIKAHIMSAEAGKEILEAIEENRRMFH